MKSKRPQDTTESDRSFLGDERAIEGLPIRLVIALVIGVASLGIMLQILGGVGTFETDTEVDVEFEDPSIEEGENDVTVNVVDEDGNEVTDAVVVAEAGSVRMDNALSAQTGPDDNSVTFAFGRDANMELPPDQSTGEIEFIVQPPADSNWADEEPNNKLLVIES
ncbi:DUF7382 domain-containing protein [Natranaeroarchaeum aerophilus]|uniref:Carboxypeptidase regulatory-like domain-containing protein n=1 Tax=Natranaeroarchaeum aerophilus TaxID=2917711 RepID=A0AAE3FQA0_9EURY|nr:carboxypeptidase regulatory-like domain-containing protein [Natranaeroarchaeum aerophilus]MCL9812898.1 carboxypeptidase regulatory-like domain-containing protein [Natranaeroarchaeum aerophilus]